MSWVCVAETFSVLVRVLLPSQLPVVFLPGKSALRWLFWWEDRGGGTIDRLKAVWGLYYCDAR